MKKPTTPTDEIRRELKLLDRTLNALKYTAKRQNGRLKRAENALAVHERRLAAARQRLAKVRENASFWQAADAKAITERRAILLGRLAAQLHA